MKTFTKKFSIFVLSISVLAISCTICANAASSSFTTTGGQYNKTWNMSMSSSLIGNTYYQLSATGIQPQYYTFDTVKGTATLYSTTNVSSTDTKYDAYTVTPSVSVNKNIAGGRGSFYLYVNDIVYGCGSKTIYN